MSFNRFEDRRNEMRISPHAGQRAGAAKTPLDAQGFTLIEIIVVLALLSVLGSMAVERVITLDTSAVQKSFAYALNELNASESLSWSKIKLSNTGWVADEHLFPEVDPDLGSDYRWQARSNSGGTLQFRNQDFDLLRKPSTAMEPGCWATK
jgi:prepilin-type N-terminal cleavage/methylation domain-containing protein